MCDLIKATSAGQRNIPVLREAPFIFNLTVAHKRSLFPHLFLVGVKWSAALFTRQLL